jgi:restriction system protein
MWMIRAAPKGILADAFVSSGVVALGLSELGDLRQFQTKSELAREIQLRWPQWGDRHIGSATNQLLRFRDDVKIGDAVITYDLKRRLYHIGTVTGDYLHSSDIVPLYSHIRAVHWQGELNRGDLSKSSQNSLGSTSPLFEVPTAARNEILVAADKVCDAGESR